MQYPIAEVFESPQGEGTWLGTLMTFIRLAGCNVGKPYTPTAREELGLNVYQERCSDWQGVGFPCDTDYRVKQRLTVDQILELPEVRRARRVLFTGGEPLLHDLAPLCATLGHRGIKTHIETSGTKDWRSYWNYDTNIYAMPWICVSPKQGFIPELLPLVNEVKVLIGDEFDEDNFVRSFVLDGIAKHSSMYLDGKLFISPVNSEHNINDANTQKCLALQRKYPALRITLQAHKLWRVR